MENLALIMIFLGIPSILGWMFRTHLGHQRDMRVLQLKAEMNARLLDRLGSEPGVLDVLKSEGQQRLFEVSLPEMSRVPTPYGRMLTAAQIGLVLLSAGAGLLYIRSFMGHESDQEVTLVFGTLGVSIGVGGLLAAAAAFVAARIWQNGQEP